MWRISDMWRILDFLLYILPIILYNTFSVKPGLSFNNIISIPISFHGFTYRFLQGQGEKQIEHIFPMYISIEIDFATLSIFY